jgi:hypothetical protein
MESRNDCHKAASRTARGHVQRGIKGGMEIIAADMFIGLQRKWHIGCSVGYSKACGDYTGSGKGGAGSGIMGAGAPVGPPPPHDTA